MAKNDFNLKLARKKVHFGTGQERFQFETGQKKKFTSELAKNNFNLKLAS